MGGKLRDVFINSMGDPFTMYTYQINTLYTLRYLSVIPSMRLGKTGAKKRK